MYFLQDIRVHEVFSTFETAIFPNAKFILFQNTHYQLKEIQLRRMGTAFPVTKILSTDKLA